jgi:hypothetical protein
MSQFAQSAAPGVAGLQSRIAGQVVTASDPGWDEARLAWNLAVDQRPAAVVLAESATDILETVRFARDNGYRIAPQGTGHGASALSLETDTILVKTARMRGVSVDAGARRARAEAGAWWLDVCEPAAEHGLVPLHGSSPDVGVVGYTLGGGMGWLARSHGLATNSVLAVELVTADGRLVRADAENEADLFWAVRGGGGSFGVVTAIEFALYPLTEIYAGTLFFAADRGGEVLHAWRDWVDTVPEEVTSVGRYLTFPPIPDVPEPLRGRAFVVVELAYQGGEADGNALVAPLRALQPEMDTTALGPASVLRMLHMDPPKPVPGSGDGMLLADAPAEAIDAMVAVAGPGSGSPLLSVELRHLGGELARPKAGNGALASLDAGFAMFAIGITATPEQAAAVDGHVDVVKDALARWAAGSDYMNFVERPAGSARLFPETTYGRLRRIKAEADPAGLFVANHPIAPAGA